MTRRGAPHLLFVELPEFKNTMIHILGLKGKKPQRSSCMKHAPQASTHNQILQSEGLGLCAFLRSLELPCISSRTALLGYRVC